MRSVDIIIKEDAPRVTGKIVTPTPYLVRGKAAGQRVLDSQKYHMLVDGTPYINFFPLFIRKSTRRAEYVISFFTTNDQLAGHFDRRRNEKNARLHHDEFRIFYRGSWMYFAEMELRQYKLEILGHDATFLGKHLEKKYCIKIQCRGMFYVEPGNIYDHFTEKDFKRINKEKKDRLKSLPAPR